MNKGDTVGVKFALDELLVEVVTGEDLGQYPEDFTVSNVRIALSFLICLMAPCSHFLQPSYLDKKFLQDDDGAHVGGVYDKYLPLPQGFVITDAHVVLTCLVMFLILSAALTAFAYFHEKDAILITKPKTVC